jgi:Flp pilus assembly protein TadG
MRARRDAAGGERGTAAVEFALVLPLVLVVVLGLVQVGLIARDRLLVEAAARAGARTAAVEPDPAAAAAAAAAAAPGLDTTSLVVSTERAGTRGDPVTVHVVYDDAVRVPLVAWLVGDAITLHADAVMRQEFA